ncbi:voltage-dependent T-type calcium channel subunit alpha-1H isoform X6 [Neocloeon triangulifer]|uniref:voltage-dependent T-type calcium channel subunit alpha-1H isoform X6 n=1 Tax=Neocloeon triangulifer TaxID=2078957 RepID=UPI00286EDF92|nr:voltage-dependent T-type calcium channel subunit alpha-1H isoform X6 [Neocloeon triangulifer]
MVRQGTTSFGGEQVYGGASGGGADSESDVPLSDFEDDDDDDDEDDDEEDLPYPGFIPLALGCLDQQTRPRNWCLRMITNPWFERVSMMIILFNCVTLGMYRPCIDDDCTTSRCKILQIFDDFIFAFFAIEMTIKMLAMGVYGKGTYLADTWNRLDFFIVMAGALEYCLNVENMNLSAIRTIRVLRPLRAINRIPSMRILVMLLLDTLPMLGNVLLLCFFVFFIFGIVGVQLWEGILRQRCFLKQLPNISYPQSLPDFYTMRVKVTLPLSSYYRYLEQDRDYICSKPEDNGMHLCSNLPPYRHNGIECNGTALPFSNNFPTNSNCVNWNQYYTECKSQGNNPFQGAISFDNIGLAWVAIFLVISLEGWTDIMYYVQDAHSFWDWIYFVLLIVIGSFFMINLCLVVIATQFSETKKREMERMRLERARFHSSSTLASTQNSEPTTCYAELVRYTAHLWRRAKRRIINRYRLYQCRKQQQHQQLPNAIQHPPLSFQPCARHAEFVCRHGLSRKSQAGPGPPPPRVLEHEEAGRGPPVCPVGPRPPDNEPELNSPPPSHAPRASPEVSDIDPVSSPRVKHVSSGGGGGLLRVPSFNGGWEGEGGGNGGGLLSPGNGSAASRRRSSVMFSDVVMLHDDQGSTSSAPGVTKNVCSSEKMTQAGDGNIHSWRGGRGFSAQSSFDAGGPAYQLDLHRQSTISAPAPMTCQELLALSGALSAALPTQLALDSRHVHSFFSSLSKGDRRHVSAPADLQTDQMDWDSEVDECGECTSECEAEWYAHEQSCCYQQALRPPAKKSCCTRCLGSVRRVIKALVEHKYFQQGILLAILVNTLSMGIEYHNQPEELTVIVEYSNVVFSGIFAVEMLLKVTAEGPFAYISNGFNVFDGIIVVLSVVELCQTFLGERDGGSSGLSVLRTFRLLRILKLVRFMPNLRRQLFVMLRTMDNVAVFFALLILFIFIFSILGMYLFGGKFCMWYDGTRECSCHEIVNHDPKCVCDRKHFNNILWATVTVFQILTQEDWNVVLFNGMEKTSHWAALYFVALMTFGNYVLFNLLVAILVEGFSAEENVLKPDNPTRNNTFGQHDRENSWKVRTQVEFEPKCNIQKESQMLQQQQAQQQGGSATPPPAPQAPVITHTAATPQDSPNATLEPGAVGLHRLNPNISLYASSLSIDSIDRSSRIQRLWENRLHFSSQCSIPGLLRPPAAAPSNPHASRQSSGSNTPRRVSLSVTPPSGSRPNSSLNRTAGWRISRPSLRSRQRPPGAEEAPEDFVLNNGAHSNSYNHSRQINNLAVPAMQEGDQHLHCNGGLLGSIRNDTQSPSRNNLLSVQAPATSSCSLRRPSACSTLLPPSVSNPASRSPSIAPPHSPFMQGTSWPGHHVSYHQHRHASLCEGAQVPMRLMHHRPSLGPQVGCGYRSRHASICMHHHHHHPIVSERSSFTSNKLSTSPLPQVKVGAEDEEPKVKKIFKFFEPRGCLKERDDYSLYIFSPDDSKFRNLCSWIVERRWFDNVVLFFIGLNCITLAMERPNIPPDSTERMFLSTANYVFTVVFALEMLIKVIATGMFYGREAYFTSGWNIMDGVLVLISIVDLLMSVISESSPRIFGILRVFRLLRSLRPLRVINRAPGLKLVVQTLLSSLRPIGNIVLICCTFFIIFGILGVQLFKGAFYYCEGPDIKNVRNKTDCLADKKNSWVNRKYNFDDLGKALMSLFVLSSKDGWVNIMYTGLDAVGVDQQPIENFSEWRLLYFISFLLLVGFFVLNMFVGVVVENFHRCREEQEKEEKARRAAKRAKQMEKKRRRMHEPPYYATYSRPRLLVHNVVTSKYFDLAIAAVIGLNVVTMALEFYMMPKALSYALKIFNYFFTAVFILESIMKLVALGMHLYFKDRWNQLDVIIVILSIVGIVLEEVESKIIPINPTIIRVMRVLRIARVLKLLKMAKGIRALLDTVMQALPQVGNLGLLFFLLFFIFAALGVELFGRLECSEEIPCQGLGEHAHFSNFGMAFLTLFRVATGDNWNGIMKDTLRDTCDDAADCVRNCCVSTVIAPIFFVIFVLMAQFVLVNVVVAVLMKHLEESHKQMEDELDMEVELERELQAEQEEAEEAEAAEALRLTMQEEEENNLGKHKQLSKVLSLPANFTFHSMEQGQADKITNGDSFSEDADGVKQLSRPTHLTPLRRRIPPAYPANNCAKAVLCRRSGSEPSINAASGGGGGGLARPGERKELRRPGSSGSLHALVMPRDTSSGLSPECVAPGKTLVPPPYQTPSSEQAPPIGATSPTFSISYSDSCSETVSSSESITSPSEL